MLVYLLPYGVLDTIIGPFPQGRHTGRNHRTRDDSPYTINIRCHQYTHRRPAGDEIAQRLHISPLAVCKKMFSAFPSQWDIAVSLLPVMTACSALTATGRKSRQHYPNTDRKYRKNVRQP
ncbi:hypothetical protein CGL57_06960 [Edwardsiella anguillarum]|nr:hypothetical protein QY76_06805 [Edwardsiella sp. EA181011]RFT04291.1 hypothetical protein CGL57_06960 [Edwardsiella anguillarum]